MSNSYDGDPLDLSWQTPPWQRDGDGETVSGTTTDDQASESASLAPENSTSLQAAVVQTRALNHDLTLQEIADEVGCSKPYVWDVLNQRSGNDRDWKETFDELPPRQQQIVRLRVWRPGVTQRSIAQTVGVSEAVVSRTLSSNQHITDRLATTRDRILDESRES